jgi:hypothetical protein
MRDLLSSSVRVKFRETVTRCVFPRSYAYVILLTLLAPISATGQQPAVAPPFRFEEVMIPMRDGIRLQTVILTPVGANGPLPILFQRTPYGVPSKAPTEINPSLKELAQDGYIFVYQNLRGRFKSEGEFLLSSWVNLEDPKATNETTDAYDSIEWLVKNGGVDDGSCPVASAPCAKSYQRAGVARRSVDERRFSPVWGATGELRL